MLKHQTMHCTPQHKFHQFAIIFFWKYVSKHTLILCYLLISCNFIHYFKNDMALRRLYNTFVTFWRKYRFDDRQLLVFKRGHLWVRPEFLLLFGLSQIIRFVKVLKIRLWLNDDFITGAKFFQWSHVLEFGNRKMSLGAKPGGYSGRRSNS